MTMSMRPATAKHLKPIGRASRTGLSAVLLAAAGCLFFPAAGNAAYPDRPVRIIVPFGPGGVADVTTRIVANQLGKKLGQRFVVENQAGAGGIIAAQSALSSPSDGYTLALLTNGTAISVPLFRKLPFNPLTDFEPISSLGYFDFILAVNKNSPYRSLSDFLDAARKRPGSLNVGTVDVGSTQNLAAQLLKSTAHVNFAIIPYRTTPQVAVALLQNQVQLMIDSYAGLKPQLTAGKVRVIASTGAVRSSVLPNVPTVRESGIKGFDVTAWNGLFAPRGTPARVVNKINRALKSILAQPQVKRRFLQLGIQAKASSPGDVVARLKSDIAKWSQVIKLAHIAKR